MERDTDTKEIEKREQLTENFYRDEFACPCCGDASIDIKLVQSLQRLRDAFGGPIKITSGVRCTSRNKEVGGTKFSAHLYGFAVDFSCTDSSQRWELVALCQTIFKRVGVYDGWIHVDIDPQKPQQVMWVG
jgi:zinc D-Ala-D-Ala carboxypeptidase